MNDNKLTGTGCGGSNLRQAAGFSDNWFGFMEAEKKLRMAAAKYHKEIAIETIKQDVLLSLENRQGQLITTRLMSEGYIQEKIIEQVWDRLVYLVFYGEDCVAAWSTDALCRLSNAKKEECKNEIIRLIFRYANEETKDDISLRFGLRLLERLAFDNEAGEYIRTFGARMGSE